MRLKHWRRLWQPQRGLFWLMLLFNLLPSTLAWVMRSFPLNAAGLLLVGGMALMNIIMGLWTMAALMKLPRGTPDDPA